jgi:hypothetical protein
MVSAGDHERLPKRDKEKKEYGDEINLKKDKYFKKAQIPDKVLKALRKGIKNPSKFNMFKERDDEKVKVFKSGNSGLTSPVKSAGNQNFDDMSQFVAAAKQGKIGMKIANKANPKKGKG